MRRRLIIVLGPTAVGKTDYSIDLALKYGSPVISCDSRQIYKHMTIGTAVPTREQLAAVKHYFIQTKELTEVYTAGKYEIEALALIRRLFDEGHETLVACGGSMFYIDALVSGIAPTPPADPEVRAALQDRLDREGAEALVSELQKADPGISGTIDLANMRKVMRALEVIAITGQPYSSFKMTAPKQRDFEIEKVGIMREREELYARIDARAERMFADGLINEVRSLNEFRNLSALQTVGYREVFDLLDGAICEEEAVSLVKRDTRHYAKRQLTWWRPDESIRWINL